MTKGCYNGDPAYLDDRMDLATVTLGCIGSWAGPGYTAFRSDDWATDGYVEVLPNGTFRYYRHANSVMYWPWSPTTTDIVRKNYRFVRKGMEND